eukprot:Opistho-2@5914
MDYFALKTVHQTAVALSIGGFFARGLGGLIGADWVRSRLARSLPHLVDSVLLLSALSLAWLLRLSPLEASWLLSKIIGLLIYIGLGMIALRPGRALGWRATAWLGALLTVAWIASVAISKSPWGFFAGLSAGG